MAIALTQEEIKADNYIEQLREYLYELTAEQHEIDWSLGYDTLKSKVLFFENQRNGLQIDCDDKVWLPGSEQVGVPGIYEYYLTRLNSRKDNRIAKSLLEKLNRIKDYHNKIRESMDK